MTMHNANSPYITWTAALGATSYNVYRSPVACSTSPTLSTIIGNTTNTYYLDSNLPHGIYCYTITSVNGSGEGTQEIPFFDIVIP